MPDEPDQQSDKSSLLDTVEANQGILENNAEKIRTVFESVFEEDEKDYDKIEEIGTNLSWILDEEGSDNDVDKLINTIFNLSFTYDSDIHERLRQREIDEDIIELFGDLRIKYGADLERTANRRKMGPLWWSSISTSMEMNSEQTILKHEFTLNKSKTVGITSNVGSAPIICLHILDQIKNARNDVGEHVLSEVDEGIIGEIKDSAEDILSMVEDYETDSEDTDDDPDEIY